MQILETAYVAENKNGLFLSQHGSTLTYTRTYAMLCGREEDFDYYLNNYGNKREDFVIKKIFLCAPTTEEIS